MAQPATLPAAASVLLPGTQATPSWVAPATAGGAILLGVLLMGWQLWQRRWHQARAGRSAKRPGTAHTELQEFCQEATEVVERLAAMLDSKSDRLERLLQEADQRLQALEHAGQGVRREAFAEGARRAMRPHARTGDDSMAGDGALQQRILEMAERGLKPVDIARQLHQPVGQIELVIALYRGAATL